MSKAKKKHVILFIISCVLLVASVAGLIVAFVQLRNQVPAQPSEPMEPIEALITAGLTAFVYVMVMVLILLICAFIWGIGLLVSAYLAFRKQEVPRPLWICSVILSVIYGVLTVGALGVVAYAVITLFM